MAFAELATTFPNASGIPGFCQEIFKSKDSESKKYDRGRFIGGFVGWAYWLVWAPGLAVFIIIICNYLGAVFPELAAMDQLQLNIILGLIVLGGLAVIASTGLKSGAILGLIVGLLTIVPIALIALAPFATGNFHMENITSAMVPADWTWDGDHIMMILGLVVLAQWSACCWEMVAVYGPEYNKPSVDVPKALFAAGIVCLVMYVLIQTSVIGALGVEGVLAEPISPLYGVAVTCFGSLAGSIVILLMVFACILLIQIGYSAGARAMHSMALEGNLPRWFAKTNSKGEPMRGILVIALFNLLLLFILQGNPVAILAMSAIGYVFVFALALFAYVKANRDPNLAKLERPYKAPRGWKWVALVLGILQMPFLLIGAVYINNYAYGLAPTLVGFGVLALFIPLWFYSQRENHKERTKAHMNEKAEPN